MARLHNPQQSNPRRTLRAPVEAAATLTARLRLGVSLLLFGLAALASGAALTGCSAPTAGMWQGTVDIGPIDAFDLTVMLPEEGFEGEVEVAFKGEPARFSVCKGRARNGNFELEIDWTHRDCKLPNGTAPDRRLLRGTVGEGVIAGTLLRPVAGGRNEQLGFFRAYRPAGS